jgi:2-keto-4-pentenoate hydratase/2-oxohepta-3-ene-1,7-dioic acid hydratase in catechol pathway
MQVARVITKNQQIQFVKPENGRFKLLRGDLIHGFEEVETFFEEKSLSFLPPVIPSKFIGIGNNFPENDGDVNNLNLPNFFIKTPNAVVGHKSVVSLPHVFGSTVVEGEFAVILKKGGRNIPAEKVPEHILGYTVVCDLSGRDFIYPREQIPVAVKKSCDGFAPIGPLLTLDNQLREFTIKTYVDGRQVQIGHSSSMFFDIPTCIAYISSLMTLEPYDIISMGTPEPKSIVTRGQTVQVDVESLGVLEFVIY